MGFSPISVIRLAFGRLGSGQGPVWRGGPGDIVLELDGAGVIQDASPSAWEIIGATGALAGRSLLDFVPRDGRGPLRAAFAHARERGVFADPARLRAEFLLLRVRRAAAPAEIILRPHRDGGLSALIQLGQQHARGPARLSLVDPVASSSAGPSSAAANDERPEANPEAETANEAGPGADTHMLADLAHEMKTPLNAIMGFADAMRSGTYGPVGADPHGRQKYGEYLNHIHASGAHLSALIESAQDFARTRTGHYRLDCMQADVGALARECAEMVRGAAEAAGLSLKLEIADDLAPALLDARAVRQILINLLTNAVKFTREGEITLSVAENCGALDFTVADTGIGMNRIVLAKLGGRYSDTHQNGVRGTKGAGLGLSLAFELARLHGGALKLTSAPGEGTSARLTLPLGDKAGAALAASASGGDIQSQLDRVNAFRAERARAASAA